MQSKYNEALQKIHYINSQTTKQSQLTSMGFTSNLDILCDFNTKIFNRMIIKYRENIDIHNLKKAKIIKNKQELVESVLYYMYNCLGGEIDIEDVSLLLEEFEHKNAMGGTATQAALALAQINYASLVHISDDSKEVCNILNKPCIYCVNDDEKLVNPDEIISKNETEIHCVLQYKKGDIIHIGNAELKLKESNRIIITKVSVNKELPLHEPFFNYIKSNAKSISSYVVSSFNCIDTKERLIEVLNHIIASINDYTKANPKGIVFYENAHFHDMALYMLCMDILFKNVHIVSMNEEELANTLKLLSLDYNINNSEELIKALEKIKSIYSIQKGLIIHTKDYSLYYGETVDFDMEKGLAMGNLLAGAKTLTEKYGDIELIEYVNSMPLNQKGMELKHNLKNQINTIVVATKAIEKPKYTIGLGDSFVAGMQLCFNKNLF